MYVYPAIFSNCAEGGYAIRFPDLPGTNTQGDSMADAIAMARDALAMWLDYMKDDGKAFPPASAPEKLTLEADQFVTMIDVDLDAYRRRKDSKAVKKTLTIPAWMNTMAEEAGLSCSQILQDALRERLGVSR